jgi:NAD(P)-dependent dehydrogenase (short-subunit alcohol dehydrogenase family)
MAKVALVTGASRGLGLELAKALTKADWKVIINGRNAGALEAARRDIGGDIVAVAGDVVDPAHRVELCKAVDEAGGVDIVVNNAGILGPSPQPSLLDYPLDVLEDVYRANTIAPLAVLQAVRGSMKTGAKVINITSDAGVEAYEGWGGYGSSKAGLEQISKVLAVENPDWRVYWVDPGDMNTQMHQEAFPGEDISDRPHPETSVPGLMKLIEGDLPSGRYSARAID